MTLRESRDAKHNGEIDVTSWQWRMNQSGTTHMGTGGGAGKVSIHDISITKHIDKASPNLIAACCSGKHFKEAILTIRKAGEKPLEYLKISMKDIIISHVTMSSNEGNESLTETVDLNFAEFTTEYVPQRADGSGEAAIEAGFSIAKNIRL